MKRLVLIAAAFALPLGGCAAIAPAILSGIVSASNPAEAVGDKVLLEGTRALVLAHNAYQGATAVVTPLVRQDVFNATQLDMIETLSNQAVALLEGADGTLSEAERASGVFTIASQLNSIASAARKD